MLVVRTLNINEALSRLRSHGVSITQDKFDALCQAGIFDFAAVAGLDKRTYFISEKKLNAWLKEYGEEVAELNPFQEVPNAKTV